MTPQAVPQAGTTLFHHPKLGPNLDERPLSMASEIIDTDFEDDASEGDEYFPKPSFESVSDGLDDAHHRFHPLTTPKQDSRRRSQTTISSVEEALTPNSIRGSARGLPFELTIKPAVQGPSGPHLFRSSVGSAEFNFDHALQMSPLLPKEMTLWPQAALADHVVSASQPLHQAEHDGSDESFIRQWSTQDVVDWMLSAGLDASVIECFEIHDVDGTVLLDLEFEDLKELDIQSFGKRHQLWNAIADLRGFERHPSPQPTPFQDISRPCTTTPRRSASRRVASRRASAGDEGPSAGPTAADEKKRRGRKPSKDIVTPAESVSIVAIEQLLPKPHVCSKGERCAKWRKQQRDINQLQSENGIGRFPISPTKGGHIFVMGDPGNAAVAENMIPNAHLQIDTSRGHGEAQVPLESAGFPSVVASSGLLSPNQLPAFVLHEDMLSKVAHRDPQENVKQFLNFQHLQSPIIPVDDAPPSPPPEMSPPRADPVRRAGSVPPLFPEKYHQAYPSLNRPEQISAPHQGLKSLPRLDIPHSANVASDLSAGFSADPLTAIPASACHTAVQSPGHAYRLGTPASEIDVPHVSALETVSRDASQSVPPNMRYCPNQSFRSGSRATMRRPSALPAVMEGEIFSPVDEAQPRPSIGSSHSSGSIARVQDPAHHSPQTLKFGYGEGCSHAGWMKKRRTKLLRHEWQDAHFRLKGTRLDMHANARLSAATLDSINVDDYAVACSSGASAGKLSAAMKAFNIKNDKAKDVDATAFAFQLIPSRDGAAEEHRRRLALSKTHHFAVNTKDDRIDWMREIMLAQALHQKGKGYQVEINGQAA